MEGLIPTTAELGLIAEEISPLFLDQQAVLGKELKEYFPDTDKRFKNIKSTILLKKVVEEILPPFKINNIDIIVKLEKPKLSPFKEKIKENLSRLLDIEESCISIKAKRGEGLGVVGRGEAVEVFCVVNLSSLNLNY